MGIDGKPFKIYTLDTSVSILDRLAVLRSTSPSYIKLYYKDNDLSSITTSDLIRDMREYRPEQLSDFIDRYSVIFPAIDITTMINLWYIWVLKRESKSVMNPFVAITIEEYLQSKNLNLTTIRSNISYFVDSAKDSLAKLTLRVDRDTRDYIEFSEYDPIHATQTEVVRIKTELIFTVDYDIYELFNYFKMSRDIPFAVIGSYYKIMEGFTPSDRWSLSHEQLDGDFSDKRDVLYLKTLNVKNEPQKNIDSIDVSLYSTISIFFETATEELNRRRRDDVARQEAQHRELVAALPPRVGKSVKSKKADKDTGNDTSDVPALVIDLKSTDDYNRELSRLENSIEQTSRVYLRVESSINPDLSEADLIARVLGAFPSVIKVDSQRQIQIKAEFLIPDFYLDRPLFLDACTNTRLFYTRCFIDERIKIQKDKGGVYIYFAQSDTDTEDKFITASMTEQVVEKTNLRVIASDPLLRPDVPYLRVRITRAADIAAADVFKSVLLRLFSVYIRQRDTIRARYMRYIPDFNQSLSDLRSYIELRRKKSTRTRAMLKDVDPDQFISGYSRWLCPTRRAPQIIASADESGDVPPEVARLEENDVQVMLFPKNPVEDGRKYSQYYYSCNHLEKERFPALRINKLSNSEAYPIVPCCYAKDHRSKTKSKSVYRRYYEDNQSFADFRDNQDSKLESDEKHIFLTNKILPFKRFGVMVRDIDSYFKSVDLTHTYLRQGVASGLNSVIEVLLMATSDRASFESLTSEERASRVSRIRQRMARMAESSDMYQSTVSYTRDSKTIVRYLGDANKYLDPRMFIRLLESYFKCYIYIFSQNSQYPLGVLSSPYNLREFLQYRREEKRENVKSNTSDKPTVLIYEHMGTELDRSVYPQCELIVRVNSSDSITNSAAREYIFRGDYEIVTRTRSVFDEMYRSPLASGDSVIDFTTHVKYQGIDFYGKCRALHFASGVCIQTDPLPPLQLPVYSHPQSCTLAVALQFLESESISHYESRVVDSSLIGISAEKSGIKFYIALIATDSNLPDSLITSTNYPRLDVVSQLGRYDTYNRIARYLSEYMLYLFSIDYKLFGVGSITPQYIKAFVSRNIIIDSNVVYPKIPRIFTLLSPLLRDKKIVVPNIMVLKKMVYGLRVALRDNKFKAINYSEYKYIQSYYNDIKDFDNVDSQLIIYGQSALIKWIQNVRVIYTLHESVHHTGVSLLTELSRYNTALPYIVIFFATWNKASKQLLSRVVAPRGTGDNRRDLITRYGTQFNFVYIDIDNNRGIAKNYDISSVPLIYFFKITDERLVTIATIKYESSVGETVRSIENQIVKVVG